MSAACRKTFFGFAVFLFGLQLRAQEISVGGGGMRTPDSSQTTYNWQIEYRGNLSPRFAWSLAWLNEGHVTGHHRDGVAAQIWGGLPVFGERTQVAVGVGAYQFFDTQAGTDGDSRIQHGWAPMGSLSLTRYTGSRWFWRLTANAIVPEDGITTQTIALAVGYSLQRETAGGGRFVPVADHSRTTGKELTVFAGKTVVNASVGTRAVAASVEYRQGFARNLDWTISWLHEGDPTVIERDGPAAQVWLVDAFRDQRLTLGLGAGLYYFSDGARAEPVGDSREFAGLLSPTVSYRFAESWQTRFVWHRVISHYHRDTDVFLLGVGRRW